jgi:hypothetical protein
MKLFEMDKTPYSYRITYGDDNYDAVFDVNGITHVMYRGVQLDYTNYPELVRWVNSLTANDFEPF